jgi:hypothetical protein
MKGNQTNSGSGSIITMVKTSLEKINSRFKQAKESIGWMLVAYACSLSHLGGRNQEDHGSKLAPGK